MSAIGTLRSRERTAKIAKARLTEKLQKINDVYGRLYTHLESLETLESELKIGLVERANRIDCLLTEVAEMIGNHRSNLMSKFNETSQLLNSVFDQQKRICKGVLEQAKQNLDSVSQLMGDTPESPLIQQYSSLSQTMEDTLIAGLILLDDSSQETLTQLPSTLEHTEKVDANVILTTLKDITKPTEGNISNTLKTISDESSSNLSCDLLLTDSRHDDTSNTNVDGHSAVEKSNESKSQDVDFPVDQSDITHSTPLSIPDLSLPLNTVLNGIILCVSTLRNIILQPYGEDLVALSLSLRDYALHEQSTCSVNNDEFTSSLAVGQVCCAKFSVDQCWYRACVSGLNDQYGARNVHVTYVDYGNQEILPLSSAHVLPLPHSFTTLPAQALYCTLQGINIPLSQPTNQLMGLIHHWLADTLSGAVVQVMVCSSEYRNEMTVDIHVASEVLMTQESFELLHRAHLELSRFINYRETSVHLVSLLNNILIVMMRNDTSCIQSDTRPYRNSLQAFSSQSEDQFYSPEGLVSPNKFSINRVTGSSELHSIKQNHTVSLSESSHSHVTPCSESCDGTVTHVQSSHSHVTPCSESCDGTVTHVQPFDISQVTQPNLSHNSSRDSHVKTICSVNTTLYEDASGSPLHVSQEQDNLFSPVSPYSSSYEPPSPIKPSIFDELGGSDRLILERTSDRTNSLIPISDASNTCSLISVPTEKFDSIPRNNMLNNADIPDNLISVPDRLTPVPDSRIPVPESPDSIIVMSQSLTPFPGTPISLPILDSPIPIPSPGTPISLPILDSPIPIPIPSPVTPISLPILDSPVPIPSPGTPISLPILDSPIPIPIVSFNSHTYPTALIPIPTTAPGHFFSIPQFGSGTVSFSTSNSLIPIPVNAIIQLEDYSIEVQDLSITYISSNESSDQNVVSSQVPELITFSDDDTVIEIKQDPNITSSGKTKEDPSITSSDKTKEDPSITSSDKTKEDPSITSSGETKEDPDITSNGETKEDPSITSSGKTKEDPSITSSDKTKQDPDIVFKDSGTLEPDSVVIKSVNDSEIKLNKDEDSDELVLDNDLVSKPLINIDSSVIKQVDIQSNKDDESAIDQLDPLNNVSIVEQIDEEYNPLIKQEADPVIKLVDDPIINPIVSLNEVESSIINQEADPVIKLVYEDDDPSIPILESYTPSSTFSISDDDTIISPPTEFNILDTVTLNGVCSNAIDTSTDIKLDVVPSTQPCAPVVTMSLLGTHTSDPESKTSLDEVTTTPKTHLSEVKLKTTELSLGSSSEFPLVVSHIESPWLFYVFPTEQSAETLSDLEFSLFQYYSNPNNCRILKDETSIIVGSLCCLQEEENGMINIYRGVVTSLSVAMETTDSTQPHCSVMCIDYGWRKSVAMDTLFVLEAQFLELPIQCVPCILNGIAPVVSDGDCFVENRSPSVVNSDDISSLSSSDSLRNKKKLLISLLDSVSISTDDDCIGNDVLEIGNEDEQIGNEDGQVRDEDGCCIKSEPLKGSHEDSNNLKISFDHLHNIKWDHDAIEMFTSHVWDKHLVGVVYEIQDYEISVHETPWVKGHIYHIVLYDTTDEDDLVINNVLIESGLATPINNNGKSTTLLISPDSPQTENEMANWNPMTTDFLSSRNVYSVDDEDVGSALMGYKGSTQRVCRFFNTSQGCDRGDACPYQHLPEGISDQQEQEAFTLPPGLTLPRAGSWILFIVTAIQSANRFMGQILGSPDDIENRNVSSLKFLTLLEEMDQSYRKEGRSNQQMILPNPGELVAVWCESAGHWYRALVKEELGNALEVFYIDVGYEDIVPGERVRPIQPQFIHLPMQAVECCLSNTKLPHNISLDVLKLAKEHVEKLVLDKILVAKINWRSNGGVLFAEIYKTNSNKKRSGDESISLNQYLISHGYLLESDETIIIPNNGHHSYHSNSSTRKPLQFIPG